MAEPPPHPSTGSFGSPGGAPRGPYGPVPPGGPGGPGFPGVPGGPLPPGWGGAGITGANGGAPGGGPGPAGAPPAGERVRCLRRRLILGIAAAGAALAVIAGFVWGAVDGGPPYADLAECAELLPADAVDTVPGFEGVTFGGVVLTGARLPDREPDLVQQVQCSGSGGRNDPLTSASLRRYRPETENADYATLQRALDRDRVDLTGGVEVGSAVRAGEAYYGSAVADVEVDRLGVGDEGFVVAYTDIGAEDLPNLDGAADSWTVAQFRKRNLMVRVLYFGTAGMSVREKLEAVVEMSRLIDRRTAAIGRTV